MLITLGLYSVTGDVSGLKFFFIIVFNICMKHILKINESNKIQSLILMCCILIADVTVVTMELCILFSVTLCQFGLGTLLTSSLLSV